jgi:hypothetical protein
MNWIQRNFKTIVYISFLVPILAVAFVSISHVTSWYELTNPMSWAIYLSVGIEIAALSALAAISAKMGSKVYFPFGVVTIIQFIGNIFFAYQYIDVQSQTFKDWVDLVDPFVIYLGIDSGDLIGHKRILSLFSGGMLPIISLSFLHMLVKFEEENKNHINEVKDPKINVNPELPNKIKPKVPKKKKIKVIEEIEEKGVDNELDSFVKMNEEKFRELDKLNEENFKSDDGVKRLVYSRRDD